MPYCSGDLWQADTVASVVTGGAHLRGDRIFKSVLATVQNVGNLDEGRVVIAGAGAGAVAINAHQVHIANVLGPHTYDLRFLLDNPWSGIEGIRLGPSLETIDSIPTANE